MKNKAIINEISEDDVNGLSDQIRQLKEELIRAKSCDTSSSGSIDGYFSRHNTRESLNLLRRSLNRSLLLPSIHNEQEYMDVDEEDVKDLCVHLNLHSSIEEHAKNMADDMVEEESDSSLNLNRSINDRGPDCFSFPGSSKLKEDRSEVSKHENSSTLNGHPIRSENLSLCVLSPPPEEPVFCASPRVDNRLKKSRSHSPSLTSKNISSGSPKFGSEKQTVNMGHPIRSSLQSNKVSPIESLEASLHRGLQIIDYHQRSLTLNTSPVVLSFEHLSSISCQSGMEKVDAPLLCSACKSQVIDNGNCNMDMQIIQISSHGSVNEATEVAATTSGDPKQRNTELEALCAEQAVKIKELESQIDLFNKLVSEQSSSLEQNPSAAKEYNGKNENIADHGISLCSIETEALSEKKQCLRKKVKSSTTCSTNVSLLELVRNGSTPVKGEEFESERQRWMESESRWICLTEELRMDLESNRRLAEKKELELNLEKQCVAELDDALHRSLQGNARIIEHYAELQEKYDELLGKHRKVMDAIAEVKKAAAKAGTKGKGSAFTAALAAELATSRIEREKERTRLKDQNRILTLQLRDTAEAVHAAGELLVRLREAEEAVSVTNVKYDQAQKEIERLKRQMERLKKKQTMEIATMKHYLAESRLPESALEPLYQHVSESVTENKAPLHDDEDVSWRSAFRPSYH